MDLALEPLPRRTVGDNVALARAVGWNDVESDWRVLHDAALVLGAYDQRRLVAQAALGDYGTAGTIAKMIVAPELQRCGIGRRLLEALIAEAQRRSIDVLGLVATPFGQPLYERYGFETTGEVVVLRGQPEVEVTGKLVTQLASALPATEVDRRFIRCTRKRMLTSRFREAVVATWVPEGDGYAMATLQGGSALVGPIVASTEEIARDLVSSLFRHVDLPVRVDVPKEHHEFRGWLREHGLTEEFVRPEMARGATRLPWQVPQRFALAAQAWG